MQFVAFSRTTMEIDRLYTQAEEADEEGDLEAAQHMRAQAEQLQVCVCGGKQQAAPVAPLRPCCSAARRLRQIGRGRPQWPQGRRAHLPRAGPQATSTAALHLYFPS
jgi:hypothetical protein